jgi:hypothetical protein
MKRSTVIAEEMRISKFVLDKVDNNYNKNDVQDKM